jgi:MoaA/NifB/PqqE/SkfB family radical SAM enzyme
VTTVVSLKTVYVHVTNACNLACTYCSLAAGVASETELAGPELAALWRGVLALAPGKVVITGGEPLARPDLIELLESYRRADSARRVPCCLNTNGTLVTPALARRIAPLLDEVRLNIGPDRAVRLAAEAGPSDTGALDEQGWDAPFRTIALFREAGLDPVAMVPVTREVLERLPRLLEGLRRRGTSRVRTLVIRRTGRARQFTESFPSYGQIAASLDVLAGRGRTEAPGAGLNVARHCGAGRFLSIMPNGDLYPCHVLTSPEFRVGNVRRDRLASVCADEGLLGQLRRLDVAEVAASDPQIGARLSLPGACLGEVYQDSMAHAVWRNVFSSSPVKAAERG